MQIRGSSLATARASFARSATSTTTPTSLYAPGASSATPRFERLSPESTGIDFMNRLEPAHPMNRLYVSGLACGSVATGDLDNDGRVDVFLVSGPGRNRLFRQVDNLRFDDITFAAKVDGGESWGARVLTAGRCSGTW